MNLEHLISFQINYCIQQIRTYKNLNDDAKLIEFVKILQYYNETAYYDTINEFYNLIITKDRFSNKYYNLITLKDTNVLLNEFNEYEDIHIKLTLNERFKDALDKCNRESDYQEIATILALKHEFNKSSFIVDNFIYDLERKNTILIIQSIEYSKLNLCTEAYNIINNLTFSSDSIFESIMIIRGLCNIELWYGYNEYPFPDW